MPGVARFGLSRGSSLVSYDETENDHGSVCKCGASSDSFH